jgi:hypothetical protein
MQATNSVDANKLLGPDDLPFEVQAMILRHAVNDILHDLRRTDSDLTYSKRLQQFVHLRLASKTFDVILSQMRFEGLSLDVLLRGKQLEKLGYVLEAVHLSSDPPNFYAYLSVPKLKRLCGRFWHNPDLKGYDIRMAAFLLRYPHSLNLAVKLETWIMRHRTRSTGSSLIYDGIFVFEPGDWIVNDGQLQIRRVSRWVPSTSSRRTIGVWLAHESGGPTPVHQRLGHERRWFIEYTNAAGIEVLKCTVNYSTKTVWDHKEDKMYDFEGRLYQFPDFDDEPSDDEESTEGEEQGEESDDGESEALEEVEPTVDSSESEEDEEEDPGESSWSEGDM